MLYDKTFLAIVPARGGSKRLPRKNILDLEGKPLIAYSIESAFNSQYIDKVVVTSDDDEILSIAEIYGSDTVKRPSALASDAATTFDVVKHVIEKVGAYDYIILLQPTSPLRESIHIDEAIELLDLKNADAIISVCEVEHSPLWANTLDDSLTMTDFLQKGIDQKRSQELEAFYRINGAIYICRVDKFLEQKSFFLQENIFAYKMDREHSIDIDEMIDFELAKLYMGRLL
jgi:CMP-N-acetylneuraminic acid synthetase